ncbi:MAG: hypothetical protein GF353_20125 [Candidatus Lokiarchaeota archaeon]|nr:hypothetical protein [Candidatus Lokiarchaeota archaeon]
MKKILCLSILQILILYNIFYGQWYDPQSTQVTVLLEKEDNGKFVTYGTGFLLYNYEKPQNPIVITCAHLLKRSKIFVSINADSTLINEFKRQKLAAIKHKRLWTLEGNKIRCLVSLREKPNRTYITHSTLDIGAFLLSFPFNKVVDDSGNVILKFVNTLSIAKSGIRLKEEAALGDEVYFVGFPFGIGSFGLVEPLVRSGSIAWFSEDYDIFLLDAFSYGGNSGSPVFLKRIISKPSHLSWENASLVGMITGHQGIKIDNVLTQPKPDELKFEKGSIEMNFGLAICVWSDDILKLSQEAMKLSIE